ncbi:hypothetical protein ACP4OV_026505 [Aristida adscensionis]
MRVWYGEAPDFRHRLIEDVGELILVGVAGGSAFHFVRGFRNSPNGCRLVGGAHAVRTNAPRFGGVCAAYSAVFCGFERAMSLARQREDHWNSIAAGAASSGLISVRRGLSAVACSALYRGTIFAVGAGVCWTIEQWHSHLMSFRDTRMSRDLQAPVATADGGWGCCRLPRRVQDQKLANNLGLVASNMNIN